MASTPKTYYVAQDETRPSHPSPGHYFDGFDKQPRGPFLIKRHAEIAAEEHVENFSGAGA